jgi:hypothetical protein
MDFISGEYLCVFLHKYRNYLQLEGSLRAKRGNKIILWSKTVKCLHSDVQHPMFTHVIHFHRGGNPAVQTIPNHCWARWKMVHPIHNLEPPPYLISWKSIKQFKSWWWWGGGQTDALDGHLISLFPISKTRLKTLGPLQVTKICTILTSKETLFDEVVTGPDRDVDTPGRLIIWHSFKPIILKYLLNIYLVEGGEKWFYINIYISWVM